MSAQKARPPHQNYSLWIALELIVIIELNINGVHNMPDLPLFEQRKRDYKYKLPVDKIIEFALVAWNDPIVQDIITQQYDVQGMRDSEIEDLTGAKTSIARNYAVEQGLSWRYGDTFSIVFRLLYMKWSGKIDSISGHAAREYLLSTKYAE